MQDTAFADIVERGRRRAEQPGAPLDMPATFVLIAEYANQHQDNCEFQELLFGVIEAITPHMSPKRTTTWWHELRRCLARAEAADTVGPAWDEGGVSWGDRAKEAADTLAAQR